MARGLLFVTVFVAACGSAAEAPLADPPRLPTGQDKGSTPPPSTPIAPRPPAECRLSPDVEGGVAPVAVPPGVIADFALPGRGPILSVTPDGEATVVWQHDGAILARSYRSSQWRDVETVVAVDRAASALGESPKLAALPTGGLIVAYHESPGFPQQVVCVRERSADGKWSTVTTLAVSGPGPGQEPSPPDYELAVDPAGNITALVRAEQVNVPLTKALPVGLLAFRAPAGGHFGEPTLLAETLSGSEFALSVDTQSGALAVWRSTGGESIEGAAFSPGVGWRRSPPAPLGDDELRAAPEADGTTSVLAVRSTSGTRRVQAVKWSGDGRWSAVSDLGESSDVYNPQIVTGGGRALVTWWGGGPDCATTSSIVRRSPGGEWSPVEAIPGAPPSNTLVGSTALSASGHTLIGWAEGHKGPKYCFDESTWRLSWITPAGTWSPPSYLDGGKSVGGPTVALTKTGRALVAWSHGDLVLVRWIDPP